MAVCHEKHGGTFTCEQLRDQMRSGSETAARMLRNRHPQEQRATAPRDMEEIAAEREAKRINKFFESLYATGVLLPETENK